MKGKNWEKQEAKEYRGGVALLNYYAQDCPEMQSPAKEASRDMAKPRSESWVELKRAVRFLAGRKASSRDLGSKRKTKS
jgi:hypothetical protein